MNPFEPSPGDICGINRERFIHFCTQVKIQAKEGDQSGESSDILIPAELIPTQVYLLDQFLDGLKNGIHFFVVLKCRQSGTTTLGLLFELWWAYTHKGFITNFIADNAQRLAINRALIENMVDTIDPAWCHPIKENNKNLLRFQNTSMVIWNNANARDEGGYGRGVGAMGFHATEIGRYRDEDGWHAMLDGLAHKNKSRFYLTEGTSEGPNLFKEVWDEASRPHNVTQRAIFIGWWLHPDYEADTSDPIGKRIYDVYWKSMPRLDRKESEWVHGVKERYNFEIRDTQMAWWRYMIAETKQRSVDRMCQEYPPLPELAWIFGGKGYVSGTSIALHVNRAKVNMEHNRFFQVEYGVTFHETKIVEVPITEAWYDLVTFVEPQKGPLVRYVIGVDPAYGASEGCDACAIQVFQCYSDCMVQVAEYNGKEEPSYHLAWVLLHLAGAYNGQTLVNIELQGGGYAIQDHIRHLQEQLDSGYDTELSKYFGDMRFYTYSTGDSINRAGSRLNWITTDATKERMLTVWKDLFEQGKVHVHSPDLISQTNKIHRLRDGDLQMPEDDHRVMAAAIAAMAYMQVLETDIGGAEMFRYADVQATTQPPDPDKPMTTATEVLQRRLLNWRADLLNRQKEEKALQIENEPEWVVQMREQLYRHNEL